MSWPQWPVGATSTLPGVINPAPTVANPTVQPVVPAQYTAEQWAQMQHQNWQQWAQWQQQYQQWHQQYGAEYQKALSAQGVATMQPPLPAVQTVTALPNTSLPPPPPVEPKPPLPPEDPPTNYNQQPPPPNKFERNYSGGRNSNWQPMEDNRNRRYSNQGTSQQDRGFGKRNSSYSTGGDLKRNKPDDNWQKMKETPPNQWNSTSQKSSPAKAINAEELSEAEKKFDKQFAEWEAQFNKWKDQNANHPDKTQYREYEKKWETWRAQLLERREQMRRKRLNLANASPNTVLKLSQNEKKQPLLNTPDSQLAGFNRPPPAVNNDPLEFCKKSDFGFDESASNHSEILEKKEFDASFLTSVNAGGIPGLDLVKEGDKDGKSDDDVIDADNVKSSILDGKPQDLDALSKGINSILGDQKLLSMLSLVSQNQNLNFNVSAATQPPLDRNELSNQSMEDASNQGGNFNFHKPIEGFNTFDDQTRSSFTAGLNDQDMRYDQPKPNDRMNFRRPPDYETFRPSDDSFRGDKGFNTAAPRNDFRGPPGYGDFQNDSKRAGFGRFDGPRGPSDFGGGGDFGTNEEQWDGYNRGPTDFNRGPNDFNRGQNEFNRGGPNNFNRPGNFNRGSPNDFDNGPNAFKRGISNDLNRAGPSNDFNRSCPPIDFNNGGPNEFSRGPNDFNRGGPNNFNRGGPTDFNRGPNFEPFHDDRSRNDFNRPDRWGGDGSGPGGFSRNDRFERNSFNDQDNFRPNARDNFRGNGPNRYCPPGNFDKGPRDNFIDGPNYMENDFKNNRNNQNSGEPVDNYRRGPPGLPPNPANDEFSRFDNFNKNPNDFHRGHSENFGAQPNESWRGTPRNFDDYPRGQNDNFARGPLHDNKKDRFSGPHENRQFNFEPPDRFNQPDGGEHSICSYQEPPVSEPAVEPAAPQDILKPETVVEYDHKPLKPAEPEVIVEPIQTFDYRHKPVNRIPLPQRPQWLSETLRNVREFEPLLSMRPLEQTRRFEWPYDDRKRYDPYYDDRRRYDYIEPRGDLRYSYEGRRSYEERRSYERSRSREIDDFSENSRHGYSGRHEERRKHEDDYPSSSSRSIKYEEKLPVRSDKYEERERKKVSEESASKSASMPTAGSNSKVTLIEDILSPPGRFSRPARIVIILRGPPGSGKTTLAKLIKDKEVENGGSAPRILSLDDYFMVEHEKEVTEDGRKVKIKEMKYEYEEDMEAAYRTSLMKSFKKTITDGYFNFIIVDNVNDKVKYFGEMWSFAKQNGFQVYICQLELDIQACTKRNIHGRTETEVEKCVAGWEPTPSHHPIVDATSLIQSQSIPEVEMEEINSPPSIEEDSDEEHACRSKWDSFDCSLDNLAKLDGTNRPLKPSRTMEDYLQLDDWEPKAESKPGQKRVRWADLEERKEQEKMRAIGFVVGQTNWDRMMDPTMGGSALTQTKYIERVGKY